MTIFARRAGRTALLMSVSTLTFLSSSAFGQESNKESNKNIDEIVTTATKTETTLANAPAAMSIITSADLDLRAVVDVSEAVRQLPGVSLQGKGVGGRQVLSIRGMESEHTLFLVDGRRTAGSDALFGHSDFQNNWLPMSAVERIEVVRGPLSSLYGSDALGGVINIITKPSPQDWTGSLSTRFGFGQDDYSEQNVSANISGMAGKKVGIFLSGSYNTQDDVPYAADPRLTELEGREATNFYGRVSLAPAQGHRIILDLATTDEDRYRNTMSRGRPPLYQSSEDLNKLGYGVSYDGEFGDITVNAGYFHSQLEHTNHKTQGLSSTNPQTLKDDTFNAHAVIPFASSHRIVIGGDIRNETLVHPLLPNDEDTITYSGIFVQDEWSIGEDFTVTFGARYDDHENFGSEISPRAYAVYNINDNFTLKAGYGHGFHAPTIKQSSEEYKFRGFHSFFGNPEVGPETSDSFEAGLVYETGKMRFSTTGFYNQVDDLIVSNCIINCAMRFGRVFNWINVDETETKGIEAEVNFDISDAFTAAGSYTYMDSEDKSTGLVLANRPEHTYQASLAWNLESLGMSNLIRAEYIGDVVQYGRGGSVIDVPGYTLMHFNGSWQANDLFKVNYGVKNLSNVNLAEESDSFGYAIRGRTVYVGIGIGF